MTADNSLYPLLTPGEFHDACGTGFITEISGVPSRRVIDSALESLERLTHRGAFMHTPECLVRLLNLNPATCLLLIAKVFLSKLSFKVPLFSFNNGPLHYDKSRYNHEKNPNRINK